MGSSYTIPRQHTFERLAAVLSLQGWKDFDVHLVSDELRMERHGGGAVCTVIMLPDEPVLQAHFIFGANSVHAATFTIGELPFDPDSPAVMKSFLDVDSAARWVLDRLETGQAV